MPEITMPKLSDTMTEGTLLRWRKKKGDKVEIGDILAEVETDKATMEMEAFEEGVLTEIHVAEGGRSSLAPRSRSSSRMARNSVPSRRPPLLLQLQLLNFPLHRPVPPFRVDAPSLP